MHGKQPEWDEKLSVCMTCTRFVADTHLNSFCDHWPIKRIHYASGNHHCLCRGCTPKDETRQAFLDRGREWVDRNNCMILARRIRADPACSTRGFSVHNCHQWPEALVDAVTHTSQQSELLFRLLTAEPPVLRPEQWEYTVANVANSATLCLDNDDVITQRMVDESVVRDICQTWKSVP